MTALALDQWGRFLPEHTTAVSLLDRPLHHSIVVVTEASRSAWAKAEHGQEAASPKPETERWGTFTWPPPATRTWPLVEVVAVVVAALRWPPSRFDSVIAVRDPWMVVWIPHRDRCCVGGSAGYG
jgi:hypothetical protein